jgi:hypothetical protein
MRGRGPHRHPSLHFTPLASWPPAFVTPSFSWKFSDLLVNLDLILTDSGAPLENSDVTGGVG